MCWLRWSCHFFILILFSILIPIDCSFHALIYVQVHVIFFVCRGPNAVFVLMYSVEIIITMNSNHLLVY